MNALFIQDANKLVQFGEPTDASDVSANYERANQWPAQEAVVNANA